MQERRVERRLAAILASDVAGYSRLMGADEVGTLRALQAQRKELVDPLIAAHHGRIVKTTGDGILAEFASAVDAVGFAVAVQRGILARNANLPEERRIALRTGINIGDIIVEGGDIYGDGVNVAARLEALSEPGGVCISEDVYRQVRDKLPYAFADRGEQRVKNIARPVHVYSLDAAAVQRLPEVPLAPQGPASPASRKRAWGKIWPAPAAVAGVLAIALGIRLGFMPATAPQGPAAAPRFSMVVLAFTNLTGDTAQDYLADVITEGLTTALARIKGLFVIARSTAFTYKGKPVDVKQIGKDLGVRYLLEGSEERAGDRVRVNAQLIDAETGAHLWADQFDADRSDLLQMQDEIVTRLARAMQFEAVDIARTTRAPPENLDAEDLAERCNVDSINAWGDSNRLAAAFSLCERALQIDNRNVRALTVMALKYIIPVLTLQSADRQADIRRADELASRALAIDPNFYLAHHVKARVLDAQNRQEEAIVEAQRSLALDPISVENYIVLCEANNYLGRPDRCLEAADKAIRLSPRDPFLWIFFTMKGWAFFMKRQYDQAIHWLRRSAAITPVYSTFLLLSSALALTENQAEAHEMLKRYLALGIVHSKTIAQLRAQMSLGPDNPAFAEYTERLYAGLRKAGMPER
jgi:TolB-like protein/class 3 adenylate cyclase/Tfp pilus assembly protein PilF